MAWAFLQSAADWRLSLSFPQNQELAPDTAPDWPG